MRVRERSRQRRYAIRQSILRSFVRWETEHHALLLQAFKDIPENRHKKLRASPEFPSVIEMILMRCSTQSIANMLRATDPWTFKDNNIHALRRAIERLRSDIEE